MSTGGGHEGGGEIMCNKIGKGVIDDELVVAIQAIEADLNGKAGHEDDICGCGGEKSLTERTGTFRFGKMKGESL